jgi:hypothetical protein
MNWRNWADKETMAKCEAEFWELVKQETESVQDESFNSEVKEINDEFNK